MKNLFETFRLTDSIDVEDLSDFQVLLLDKDDPVPAAMGVTGLTIYQLEHGYDRGRYQMLLWAMSRHCDEGIRLRAMVGLLIIMARQDIQDNWALEQMADLLSYEHELAYESWQAIILTGKYPQEYDTNFEMLKQVYSMPPFSNDADLFFLPFQRGRIENLQDDEWQLIQALTKTWHLCDSDKYAFILVFQKYLPAILQQFKEMDVDIESLAGIQINMEMVGMLPGTMRQTFKRMTEGSPVRDYIQQLYRFVKLSRHTAARATEPIDKLRNTLIDKMVVIGKDEEEGMTRVSSAE